MRLKVFEFFKNVRISICFQTQGYDDIKMTLVCPYIINTDLFRGARTRIMPILEPDFVADKIVRSIELQEHVCLIPNISRFLTPLK